MVAPWVRACGTATGLSCSFYCSLVHNSTHSFYDDILWSLVCGGLRGRGPSWLATLLMPCPWAWHCRSSSPEPPPGPSTVHSSSTPLSQTQYHWHGHLSGVGRGGCYGRSQAFFFFPPLTILTWESACYITVGYTIAVATAYTWYSIVYRV